MRKVLAPLAVLALATAAAGAWAADMSRAEIQQIFDRMQSEAHWDVRKPMLWGDLLGDFRTT